MYVVGTPCHHYSLLLLAPMITCIMKWNVSCVVVFNFSRIYYFCKIISFNYIEYPGSQENPRVIFFFVTAFQPKTGWLLVIILVENKNKKRSLLPSNSWKQSFCLHFVSRNEREKRECIWDVVFSSFFKSTFSCSSRQEKIRNKTWSKTIAVLQRD